MIKIMVVDDEQDIREMINLALKKEGFETKTAFDGYNFLEEIDEFQPDLVTLDVLMPGLKTEDILERLKEKKTKPKILIVSVLKRLDKERKELFKMGNIIDYITKPFEIDDLISIILKTPIENEIQNCWEFMKCPKKTRNKCLVFKFDFGRECWFLMNTKKGCPQIEKIEGCFSCSWYKKHNS